MKRKRIIALVTFGLVIITGTIHSEGQTSIVYVYRYGLPSNQITEGIRLEFFSDGILKSAEVRSIDRLTIDEARNADFGSFVLASEAHVTRTEGSITIEVNRIERGQRFTRSFVDHNDGTVEIRLPDRPDDRAWIEIGDEASSYFFNDREISSLEMESGEFVRQTSRLRYEYGRELTNGEIGRVHWDSIDQITAITHDADRDQIDFAYFEVVPYWYRMVYTGLPPQMTFRNAVLSDHLIVYAVADALYQQLFSLIAVSVR